MKISLNNVSLDIDLKNSQKFKNMEVIPIEALSAGKKEFITLKAGIQEGYVKISECESSTVNTVMAQNKSSTPLVLIDGEEVIGAMQNRIMNRSLIVPGNTTMPISVSCTEHGRWHTRGNSPKAREFSHSDFFADYETRHRKSETLYNNSDCQSEVWASISDLEIKNSYRSPTSALNDSYVHHRPRLNEYLKHFSMLYNQIGAIFIINGQIKGLELFYNPFLCSQYYDKILKSYIMNAITNYYSNCSSNSSNIDVGAFLADLSDSKLNHSPNQGLGQHIKFSNNHGTGSALINDGEFVHLNYFKTKYDVSYKKQRKNVRTFGSFDDLLSKMDE
ncbi:hypothetical protein mru_0121 [Methanobrevibacter ruminantium M1]|uniref:ARG and Rhodanese-Phosphatase-superfamily-associated domain-containing protein n=1 Tax=Methanobrevibacter ruminantium (strain ATCC 35063 / DSM 1093 / JCM 13430 / OCM 146 / M1) TaxID=634498 RepID=D3DYQ3_METRM|nr:DUF6569 family protein [Methanobrevibacter ruminantium]ADC45973.1 hypothetical protein mru_0121 [Methanobrevibacter ruminantium M1]